MTDLLVTYPAGSTAESSTVAAVTRANGRALFAVARTPCHPESPRWPDQPADRCTLKVSGARVPVECREGRLLGGELSVAAPPGDPTGEDSVGRHLRKSGFLAGPLSDPEALASAVEDIARRWLQSSPRISVRPVARGDRVEPGAATLGNACAQWLFSRVECLSTRTSGMRSRMSVSGPKSDAVSIVRDGSSAAQKDRGLRNINATNKCT